MRAALCESWAGYKALKNTRIERPALRPGCVRIAVHYATVGFGVSLVVAGKYQRKPPLPFVPGTEIAGIVIEAADDVQGFRRGDAVAAIIDWGGYAEEAIGTAETVWHVPPGIDLSVACTMPGTYGTAYASLHWRARILPGESVAVFGAAGGVGIPAVEVARLAGAHVIAVARTAERLAVAQAHGAHEGLLNDTPDLGRVLKQHGGGRGVDIVFDPVGGKMFGEALRGTAPEGRMLVIGFASGDIPQIPANILLVKNIAVIGVNMGLYSGWTPVDERRRHAPRMKAMMETLFAHLARGELKPEPGTPYALEDVVAAFDSVIERRSTGRVVLKIQGA